MSRSCYVLKKTCKSKSCVHKAFRFTIETPFDSAPLAVLITTSFKSSTNQSNSFCQVLYSSFLVSGPRPARDQSRLGLQLLFFPPSAKISQLPSREAAFTFYSGSYRYIKAVDVCLIAWLVRKQSHQ